MTTPSRRRTRVDKRFRGPGVVVLLDQSRHYSGHRIPPWLVGYIPSLLPRSRKPEGLPRFFPPLSESIIRIAGVPKTSLEFFKLYFHTPKDGDLKVWRRYREIEENIWIQHWDQYDGFPAIIGLLVGIAAGSKASAQERLARLENDWAQFKAFIETDRFESIVESIEDDDSD